MSFYKKKKILFSLLLAGTHSRLLTSAAAHSREREKFAPKHTAVASDSKE